MKENKNMATNKAPEKLYLDTTENPDNVWLRAFRSPFNTWGIEYIRTNVFIEKACEYLEPILTEYAGFYVGGEILQHFEKYMKELL